MYQWSKRKFLETPKAQQERQMARLLKEYAQLCAWREEEMVPQITPETLSNRYHQHLQAGDRSVREPNLLPRIYTGDKEAAEAPLLIDLYLDHIRSAHNVGSILRTMEAFSLGMVHFSPQTPIPDHKQVKATAMGAAEWTKWRLSEVAELPRPLIALETAEGAIPYFEFVFPERFTLAVGNEEYGCSKEVLEQADAIVEIPLFGRKRSLNVANAFAILAAHFRLATEKFN